MSIFFETGVRRLCTGRTPVHRQTDGRWKTPQKTQSTLPCLYFSQRSCLYFFQRSGFFFFSANTFLYPSISADTQVFFSADTWSFFIHWSRQSNCGNTPRVRVDLGTTWPGSACLCVCVVRVWKMQLEVEILKFVQISKYLFELRVLYMLVFLWQCVMWYVLLLLGFLR